MGFLRSLDVKLFQMTLPKDDDWTIIAEMLKLNFIHYVDLNSNEQPHALVYSD